MKRSTKDIVRRSKAVREGVRLLEHQHRMREAELNSLRDKIAAGAAELNAGRVVDGERFFAEWDEELDGHEASRAS